MTVVYNSKYRLNFDATKGSATEAKYYTCDMQHYVFITPVKNNYSLSGTSPIQKSVEFAVSA
ncbi:MAG: hypothetical protein ABFD02_14495 [Bacteroidales bacterium]